MSRKSIDKEGSENAAPSYTKMRVIPQEIREILADLAEIRNTVLVGSPALLPQLAPALEHAEARIQEMW